MIEFLHKEIAKAESDGLTLDTLEIQRDTRGGHVGFTLFAFDRTYAIASCTIGVSEAECANLFSILQFMFEAKSRGVKIVLTDVSA